MFEFTLSKVNMLIFVTAIAVVVIFFMNTLNDNLKTRQSYETSYKIGKEIKSLFDSDSYCSIKFIDIPKTISTNKGNLSSGQASSSLMYMGQTNTIREEWLRWYFKHLTRLGKQAPLMRHWVERYMV